MSRFLSRHHTPRGYCVVLHDRRLKGGVPRRSNLGIVNTDGSTSLDLAFRSIRAEARAHRIDTLFIVCHGFAGANKIVGMSADAGGMGLQIGKENLRHANVALWKGIQGGAKRIVVMACAASDTPPGGAGTTSDGQYLMGALALHTGAEVYAANRIQIYYRYRNLIHGRVDFERWEGKLYRFPANGARSEEVDKAPVELADILGHLLPA